MGGTLRILSLLVALVMTLVWSSACSSQNEVKIGGESDGGEVKMQVGQQLVVTLASNPTTGYGWQVLETDEALLKTDGDPVYQPANRDKNLVGGGGAETLRFKALSAGQATLKLGYLRSWEKGVEPVQTFTLTVQIQ